MVAVPRFVDSDDISVVKNAGSIYGETLHA